MGQSINAVQPVSRPSMQPQNTPKHLLRKKPPPSIAPDHGGDGDNLIPYLSSSHSALTPIPTAKKRNVTTSVSPWYTEIDSN